MNWPWKRFEAMYAAHCKRLEVERATDVKNAMISGLWSNTNLDDGQNSRQQALSDIEESYQQMIFSIYSKNNPKIEMDTMEHQLFTAMKFNDDFGSVLDRTTTTEDE